MTNQIKSRPKVVVIGGGTGLPVILRGLRDKDVDITAVVTVADDGGSSGILRNYINVVPPGDIRNVLVALSGMDSLALNIFQYRFDSSDQFFAGHAIGNLIIAALSEMESGIFEAVQELSGMMKIQGRVYPAANEPLVLNAEFTDGQTLAGESAITAAHKKIDHVWVTPSQCDGHQAQAVPQVIEAILGADQIVIGPGSLFTSILPNLMIQNLGDAVCETSAEVIYISNIMTQKGETDALTDADHVRILNRHLHHQFVNTVFVNTRQVPEDYMDYQKWNELSRQVEHDQAGLEEQGVRVISNDFLKLENDGAFHNSAKVIEELIKRMRAR